MVDYFALAVSHGLLALAAWRLVLRADLDRDPADVRDRVGMAEQKPARDA